MNVFGNFTLGKIANYIIAFFSAILLFFNVAPVDTTSDTIDLNDYSLVFSDEFDGDTLNSNVWVAHNSFGVRKGGYWSGNQAFVKDGNLIIRTQYKENGEFGSGWYTCGLCTNGKFEHKYGYYECRCILPKGEGLWSAFWLMNSNVNKVTDNAKMGAEIDVFESPYYAILHGDNTWRVTTNIHYSGYELQTKYQNVCVTELDNNPYENYNTYGLLWTENEYIFYINGHEIGRSDFGGVSQENEYMILSCEVDGAEGKPTYGWSGNIENNDKATFSADFIVDYVRVYDAK